MEINDAKVKAITTVDQYFGVFHEDFNPADNLTLHTQMCILEETFEKITKYNDDYEELKIEPTSVFFSEITDLFSSLFGRDWEEAYNLILKFLELHHFPNMTKLKSELAEAEDIVEDITNDDSYSDITSDSDSADDDGSEEEEEEENNQHITMIDLKTTQ